MLAPAGVWGSNLPAGRTFTPVGCFLLCYLSKSQETDSLKPLLSVPWRLTYYFTELVLNYLLSPACLSTETCLKTLAHAHPHCCFLSPLAALLSTLLGKRCQIPLPPGPDEPSGRKELTSFQLVSCLLEFTSALAP